MASAFKLKGLESLQRDLNKLPARIKSAMIEEIEDAADAIVNKAVAKVPVDLGVLKNSIGNEPRNGGLDYIIFVDAEYGPFIEFGIGGGTQIPDELKEYAKQFKSENNTSRNMMAQPFFFQGYFEERDKLIKKIKRSY